MHLDGFIIRLFLKSSHLCNLDRAPDDGQRNCPKHVEFHSKNKFEKLVHLVGFIIRLFLKSSHLRNLDRAVPNGWIDGWLL